jgi:hypothetical protein
MKLSEVTGEVYSPTDSSYGDLKVKSAFFDAKSGTLISGDNLRFFKLP